MADQYDVFLSHAWGDRSPAQTATRPQRGLSGELFRRLRDAGLQVFFDEPSIDDGDRISVAVRQALSSSSVFVAWFSALYPTRQACRWELGTAVLLDTSGERIFAVNPEPSTEHLSGTPLADTRVATCPALEDDSGWRTLTDRVCFLVAAVRGTVFGEVQQSSTPWYPAKQPRAERFTGRLRELWRLHELLTGHEVTGASVAVGGAAVVTGLGGVGKTLLVLEYVHHYGAAWPGGVVWIRGHGYDHGADGGQTPDQHQSGLLDELMAVSASLGIDLPSLNMHAESTRRRDTLKEAIGDRLKDRGPVLWIVDDLPPVLSSAELAEWSAPGNLTAGKTLFTSRSAEYANVLPSLPLDRLADEEGYALLTLGRSPTSADEEAAARALIGVLAGHALALDVTGAAIDNTGGGRYVDWLKRLTATDTTLIDEIEHLGRLSGSAAADHTRSVVATLGMSIDQLDVAGRELLTVVGAFEAVPIPFDLLDRMMGAPESTARQRRELAVFSLTRASLARLDASTMVVHRLVGLVVCHTARLDEQTILASRVGAAEMLLVCVEPMESTRAFLPYRTHFEFSRALSLPMAQPSGHRWRRRRRPLAQALLVKIWQGKYLQLAGNFHDALLVQEGALSDSREMLGDHNTVTTGVMSDVAISYMFVGDHDNAIRLIEHAYQLNRQILGDDDPQTLATLNNVALIYLQAKRTADALAVYEVAVSRMAAVLGETHPDTLRLRNTFAEFETPHGDGTDVIASRRRIVAEMEKTLGQRHADTLTARSQLAISLWSAGQRDEAIALLEQVVAQRTDVLGSQHTDTVSARTHLAALYRDAHRYGEAVTTWDRVLADDLATIGSDDPKTVDDRIQLAAVLYAAGRVEDSIPVQQQAVADLARGRGDGHPETLVARSHLAVLYKAAGSIAEAIDLLVPVVTALAEALGPQDPETMTAQASLAASYASAGRYADAVGIQEQVLSGRQSSFGATHEATLTAQVNLAGYCQAAGHTAQAVEILRAALNCVKELDPEDPRLQGWQDVVDEWQSTTP